MIKDLPKSLVSEVEQILKQTIAEASPPDAEIETWIKSNKKRFHDEYGSRGDEVLYAKAWDMYNQKHGKNEDCAEDSYTEKHAKLKMHSGDEELGEETKVNEANEVASDEPRSAVGARNPLDQLKPKHVDVVHDYATHDGQKVIQGYRLLVQVETAHKPFFIPSPELPPAPSMEALVALMPWDRETVEAVLNGLDMPYLKPQFRTAK